MAEPAKLDLYKLHKEEYKASKSKPSLVTVGPAKYLSLTGQGDPNEEAFAVGVGAMYTAAYTIKMTRKFAHSTDGDYKVCNLEGLWWVDAPAGAAGESAAEGAGFCMDRPRDQWRYKLLIRVPDFIGPQDLSQAQESALKKGKDPAVREVALETWEEGLCVQMLHVGPYGEERRTLQAMMDFAQKNGLEFAGRHHEIYLSDPRRVAPEKLRTILRHPVRRK